MAPQQLVESEELVPLNHGQSSSRRSSIESASSASTTSLMFDRIQDRASKNGKTTKGGYLSKDKYDEFEHEVEGRNKETELVVEEGPYLLPANRQPGKKARRLFWMSCAIFMGIWLLGLAIFISRKAYRHASSIPHDPSATSSRGSGKQVTLDQVMGGQWRATSHAFSWIEGANGEDGLLLEKGGEAGKDWLIVEDVRKQSKETAALAHDSITLMKLPTFMFDGRYVQADEVWPSKDLKHVLVLSERKSVCFGSFLKRIC
jgi:dipeptidyl aminopeptidase